MEKKSRKQSELSKGIKKSYIVIGIATILFIISMFITIYSINANKPKEIDMPNFVGMNIKDAEQKAKEIGVKLEIENNGGTTIISQEPRFMEDIKIKVGTTIKVELGD